MYELSTGYTRSNMALLEPERLSKAHQDILSSSVARKFISSISIWEIGLKFGLGKLNLGSHTPEEFLMAATDLGLQTRSPEPSTYASFHNLILNPIRKDPFDRMIIWHALQDNLTLVSADDKMPQYRLYGLKLA
jgi:PIN domain nuclease of toxin-antitoxin system